MVSVLGLLTGLFSYPAALLGAFLIFPIILLYLLRPRPIVVRFPTIMFIQKTEKSRRFNTLFNRFVRDPLLIIQILVILLLTLSAAGPFIPLKEPKTGPAAVVLVLDASASMKSTVAGQTYSRFEAARRKAVDVVKELPSDSTVTLMLAENMPITVVADAAPERAIDALSKVSASDTKTNLGDAMLLGRDTLSKSTLARQMIVLSDFGPYQGLDPFVAAKIVAINSVEVSLVNVGEGEDNIGIIGFEAKRIITDRTKLSVSTAVGNFGPEGRKVDVTLTVDGSIVGSQQKTIKSGDEEFIYFSPNVTNDPHEVVVSAYTDGDLLKVDDDVRAVIPAVTFHRVLLITREDGDKFLKDALAAISTIKFDVVVPPVLPAFSNYDTIIIGDVDPTKILPGTFWNLKNHVDNGGSAIIMGSDGLGGIRNRDLEDILPVLVGENVVNKDGVTVKSAADHDVLSDVTFKTTAVNRYYLTILKENATSLAEGKNQTLISLWTYGGGRVAFFGVNPTASWSNFHLSSSFPILVAQLLDYLSSPAEQLSVHSLNTGEYLALPREMNVTTPAGREVRTRNLFADATGIYVINFGNRIDSVAVNLLSPAESNITTPTNKDLTSAEKFTPKTELTEVKKPLYPLIVAFALAVIFIEAYLYRRRGAL
ncbi:Uncharacterised protein [uncultured archaeon]|nr:Uncharacterised protein [uncultured archaeon]